MSVPREFRAHFLRHNRRVLGVAAMMLAGSLALWAGLYFLVCWLAILLATLFEGIDATAPSGVGPLFIAVAVILCGLDWLWKVFRPYSRIADRKTPLETSAELLFALPNMTVSALQTLTAFRALTEAELLAAWELLAKITREEFVRIQQLPLEIAQEGPRRRVLLALQLTGLIELKASEDGVGFRVANEAAKRMGQEHVRIRVEE